MERRRTLNLAATVAIAAAVACTAGSITGPASARAARLTRDEVQRIAAHVVDQKASSLRVAHARTAAAATDSSTLAGQPPAAYRTSLVALSGAQLQTGMVKAARWTLHDVPLGTYLMTYDLSVQTTVAGDVVACSIGFSNPVSNGSSEGVGRSSLGAVTGSGIVQRWDNHEPQLTCAAVSGLFRVSEPRFEAQSEVDLLHLDDIAGGTATVETANRD